MKYHGISPILLLLLLLSLVLSGCISQKLAQRKGLVGDLFREQLNCNLPPDIQIAVEQRRERYEEINYIHNINFVILRRCNVMPKDEFDNLLTLRWKLLRFNKENERALEEVKVMLAKYQKNPRRKAGQDICAQYDKIRSYHREYMEQSAYLLDRTEPYKPWVLDKYMFVCLSK